MKKVLFAFTSFFFTLLSYTQPFLFGTTERGGIGSNGVVYSYNVATKTFKKPLEFYGDNGVTPVGKLVLGTDQKIYGATAMGGTPIFGRGVIYSIDPLTSNPKILYSVEENSIPGQLIVASPTQFYASNDTAIYKFNIATHEFDKIYSFDPGESGERFLGSLTVASDGKLYGVRAYGFDNYIGQLISFDPSTSIYKIEYEFDQGPDIGTVYGTFPNGDLLPGPNGLLYGTTSDGGTSPGHGVIFTFDPSSSAFVVRYTFTAYGPMGDRPAFLQNGIDGKMYGFTSMGGAFDWGTAFSYSPSNNAVTKITDLDDEFYGNISQRMLIASDGNFYSTTREQGANNKGSFFSYLPATHTFQTLFDFGNDTTDNGIYPISNSLIEVPLTYSISCPGDVVVTAGPNCSTLITGIDPIVFPSSSQVSYTFLNLTAGGDTIKKGTGSVSGTSFNPFQTRVIYSIVDRPDISCSFIVTVMDETPPLLNVVDSIFHCYDDMTLPGSGSYTVPLAQVLENCAPAIAYRYVVKNEQGMIVRSGTTNNASGSFQEGRNIVEWTAIELYGTTLGNTAHDSTIVQVGSRLSADLTLVRPLTKGIAANTLYIGYSPASTARLQVVVRPASLAYTYKWSATGNAVSYRLDPQNPAVINLVANRVGSSTFAVEVTDSKGCKVHLSRTLVVEDIRCGNKLDKVIVCKPATKTTPAKTQCVAPNAVAALLNTGRILGDCFASANVKMNRTEIFPADQQEGIKLDAFPNPSAHGFSLTVTSNKKGAIRLRITDAAGRIIEQREGVLPGATIQIGVGYHQGLYICEAEQNGIKTQIRLIKQGN